VIIGGIFGADHRQYLSKSIYIPKLAIRVKYIGPLAIRRPLC